MVTDDECSESISEARRFLRGKSLPFSVANELWQSLKRCDEISLACAVLAHLTKPGALSDEIPAEQADKLCQQEALLTSKDPELSTAVRHDRALAILRRRFNLDRSSLDGDRETLGIAAGVYKRRWCDLGRLGDLIQAANLYERGARLAGRTEAESMGDDAYPHINAAFLDDLLADAGEEPERRHANAKEMRTRILAHLERSGTWFNTATRAEAYFGLRRYREARDELTAATRPAEPWELETTARQLATLAHLQEERPLDVPEVRAFFETLLPGAAAAVRSVMIGKLGLALSGGGFRASFYHLGVLARLAELDVLRHVEVLSCVSGGSIVGACYWLMLRQRLLDAQRPITRDDFINLVRKLIVHFETAVATDLRGAVQGGKLEVVWRFLRGDKGALDTNRTAKALADEFYRRLMPEKSPLYMHDLPFQPPDHQSVLTGSPAFNPTKHNWLRDVKVPALVLNATTVNTGHAWQFTPTWMGESPWAVHEAADSIPRLEWSVYDPGVNWQIEVSRAVAASAFVPFVFEPLVIGDAYLDDIKVQLVDGGVHDNQGTVSLLATSCNVLIVSDACGQLMLEPAPTPGIVGLGAYAKRAMDTLMERVRLANYADLEARKQSGLLRGLMFQHMQAGLDADPIRLKFSQEPYESRRMPLSPSGIRKDFQQALAELRTDLDAFTPNEANALMACGYQMARAAFDRDLSALKELWEPPVEKTTWPFTPMLEEITSTATSTPNRDPLLAELRNGRSVRL